ncbi:CBS domain containing-hemolysin-like protein [Kibdelosporangium banguiense]|uniref:CBS domain containing-hemolysin-like protein n=1 Tax=Kibdelosporangium banguiense TaxID=1365924 RepID=A0ABS4U2E1_9PSEU|nr:hemolysin family protein [Kibdelosporangium banguiense]MBP2330383.1 CBS domain containing-hemolysin-like protein [Kibdelosporangium banguiense]
MSGMSTGMALLITAVIIGLSAFFVAVEFALVAARRYRLEEAAERSASARAALRSSRELSLLLAGSQLGITLCTLALGAITKPAVHHMMTPLMTGWGLPEVTADVVAFVLSLIVVTFIHLVVGEMAPKSWAIAHPEKSATLLALPMRVFMWLTRPILVALNDMANWCLRKAGIPPVDELSTGRGPEDLRQLLDHSARAGALDDERHEQLATALELNSRPLHEIVRPSQELAEVPPDATPEQIRAASQVSGHLRLVVRGDDRPMGVVHVRDALLPAPDATATGLMRPVLMLQADAPIYAALTTMRETRNHLALVETDDDLIGLVTLDDVLTQLLPETSVPAPRTHA